MKASQIAIWLLDGGHWVQRILGEASIHRHRSRVWIASYTGAFGGQVWKSTGTEDRAAALTIAKALAAAARAHRAKAGSTYNKHRIRIRNSPGGTGGGLTQQEVALMMGISVRAVRTIEKRAIQKLAQHPKLAGIWRQYRAGELTEEGHLLSALEIQALLGLARSQAEREAILKVLAIVQA